ncbi:hypothetical protein LCGC14_1216680 [marine sediment metagenome]|uniref:Uncharacterized protein n=1 Tax=marine sediment metagenome TaxID=412755 RepID=A0A0F9PH04_9ZZZZ
MEQHIHCSLCGEVLKGIMPIPFANPKADRRIVCDTCASALNIAKEQSPPH